MLSWFINTVHFTTFIDNIIPFKWYIIIFQITVTKIHFFLHWGNENYCIYLFIFTFLSEIKVWSDSHLEGGFLERVFEGMDDGGGS